MILMVVGPSTLKQSFQRKVGIESSSHCLFWEEKMRLRISVKVVGLKLDKFRGMIGKRKGSGVSDGENLEQMCSILSLKNWRNEFLFIYFFQHNFCVKPYVPREPRRDPSNRRLNEHGIYIRHCQESNSQPVPSQAGADTTRPQWIGKWLCEGCVRGWNGRIAVENWI